MGIESLISFGLESYSLKKINLGNNKNFLYFELKPWKFYYPYATHNIPGFKIKTVHFMNLKEKPINKKDSNLTEHEFIESKYYLNLIVVLYEEKRN